VAGQQSERLAVKAGVRLTDTMKSVIASSRTSCGHSPVASELKKTRESSRASLGLISNWSSSVQNPEIFFKTS
jgi:hypothetical protein